MALVPYNYNQVSLTTVDSNETESFDSTPRLDLNRLLAARRRITHQKHKVYKEVLKLCHRRIEFEACRQLDKTWCVYEVPLWSPGLPRFDTAACTRYCIAKLRQNGLDVTLLPPFSLHISWQRVEDRARRRAKKKRVMAIAGIRTHSQSINKSRRSFATKNASHLDIIPPHCRKKPIPRPPAFDNNNRRHNKSSARSRSVRFTEVPSRQPESTQRHWP